MFLSLNTLSFPPHSPLNFFPPTPSITAVRLQLCCGAVLHLSGVWLFLLSLMLPESDRSPTLLVDWWCQLAKDSTTSSQIFQDIFFLDFKNSSWMLPKEVTLKGISSVVPQPALWQTELGIWNRWVSLSYLLGEITSRFPDNFQITPLCNSAKWWSMFKT